MAKKILIVDSDTAAVATMRAGLTGVGFEVESSADGKGCVELIRRTRPHLLVLAVDLPNGQNGYILCGKLKKDEELKALPIIIIGSPDGFAAHRKLKSRAEDYLTKPSEIDQLSERVGTLIGFPEPGEAAEEETFSLGEIVEEEPGLPNGSEEIALEVSDEPTVAGDPELDMLDAAFDDISTLPQPEVAEPTQPSGLALGMDDSDTGETRFGLEAPIELDVREGEDFGSLDLLGAGDVPEAAHAPPPPAQDITTEGGELRSLRARVHQLEATAEELQHQASSADARVRSLEAELELKSSELVTARAAGAGGKSDKDYFALREAANKKDKEILRLKGELNSKEQEMVDLRDREVALEQQLAEHQGQASQHESLVRTANSKAEQAALDKKRHETLLSQAKDESRSAQSQLSALQSELERHRGSADEVEQLRQRLEELEASSAKHEDRVAKLYAQLRAEDKVREKLRKALGVATQLLNEAAPAEDGNGDSGDESAAA